MDDAFSIDNNNLYIHFADPSPFIEKNGEIEKEAKIRVENLYIDKG